MQKYNAQYYECNLQATRQTTHQCYLIPVFAAVFALMFVVATPYVMVDGGMWKSETHDMESKDHMRHHAIVIDGFTGATQEKIGIVDDGACNTSVAWILSSKSRDAETNTMTASIFVVDAGNADNFKTITNTFDHSMMKERMHSGDENADLARDQI